MEGGRKGLVLCTLTAEAKRIDDPRYQFDTEEKDGVVVKCTINNAEVLDVPGQYSNSGNVEIQPQLITFNALRMIGSSQYSLCDVADYLDFLKENTSLHAKISALTTAYTVTEVNTAFEDAKAGKNVKTVLVYQK